MKTTRRNIVASTLAGSLLAPLTTSPLANIASAATTDEAEQAQPDAARTGITDTEILLGTSAAFSGPSRGLGIELYRGAMAYFTYVNENGGIHGRKVALELTDDGYQPDPAIQNTMKLMQDRNVFALFGYVGTPTVTRVLPIFKKFQDNHYYLFFPFTGAQPQRIPPYDAFAFNLRASYRQETGGLVDNFIKIGRERIGVFYQADAYGRSGIEGVRVGLKRHGLSVNGEATYKRGTKFTHIMKDQVEILARNNPQAIICIGSYAACAAFARDAIDGGLKVPIANLSFVGSENFLKLIAEETENPESYKPYLVNSQVVPSYADLSMPAVRQYAEFMDRYRPEQPTHFSDEEYVGLERSFVSLEGFLNAKLMTEILNRMGSKPKRENIPSAVYSIKDFDLGIGELVSFSTGKRQGLDRVYYTVVERHRFVPVTDWTTAFPA